jgi:hypothetical protein
MSTAQAAILLFSICGLAFLILLRPPKPDDPPFLVTLGELFLAYLLLLGGGICFATQQNDERIMIGALLMSCPVVYVWKYGRRQ